MLRCTETRIQTGHFNDELVISRPFIDMLRSSGSLYFLQNFPSLKSLRNTICGSCVAAGKFNDVQITTG